MTQVVMVKWGTKYGPEYVNGLAEAVLRHCRTGPRLICYTDRPEGIIDAVECREFPDFGVPLEKLTSRGGSLAKMAMFMRGQLTEGEPAIYLDLDTSIHGDVERLADGPRETRGVYFLQRHAIPYWRVRGLVDAVAKERYYLGNTAIMAFYPEDTYAIADLFLEKYQAWLDRDPSVTPFEAKLFEGGNESLTSAMIRERSRVFPRDLAIKFTQEYMAPVRAWAEARNKLPWVQARRARIVALTYHGRTLKPEFLAQMQDGQELDHKYHKTVWRYPAISAYWRNIVRDS